MCIYQKEYTKIQLKPFHDYTTKTGYDAQSETDSELVKLAVMTNVFLNNQQREIYINLDK